MVHHRLLASLLAVVITAGALVAQADPYQFYDDFRAWIRPLSAEFRANPRVVLDRYRAKLTGEGVDRSEIDRRINLILTDRDLLETEFWNRVLTKADQTTFNVEPNQFLVDMTKGRAPGRALDVGMGQGRNALYLAQQGWDVTGFDPAERAMAVAQRAADRTGLKLKTITAKMEEFQFGTEQWDLILFSWVGITPGVTPKVLAAMKPGGAIVVEGLPAWFGDDNGLLKLFGSFRVLRYEDTIAPSDFFNRSDMRVVRLLAEKPVR